MKKIVTSAFVTLALLPISMFACDGGVDCSAVQPAPPPPAPTSVETLTNVVSDHSGLIAGLLIGGAVIGYVVSRRRKVLAPGGTAVVATSA